jgi:hypothetical protein
MRTTGKQQAIRTAFYRFGLHGMPNGVAQDLAQHRVQIDEEHVRHMNFEMLKEWRGYYG